MPAPTAERTALEKALAWADRVLDPWHEGFHESTEKSALDQLAAATRAWLASEDVEAPPELAGVLVEADAAREATAFRALSGLDGALRRYCAGIGQPIHRRAED
jgi:hypothetical protein